MRRSELLGLSLAVLARTRGHGADPAAFRAGLFHLAQAFPGVHLIPAWIDNVLRVMLKGEVVPVPLLCSVMRALKRDAGVRNWGGHASVTGAVGLLGRVAPLCFAAPVFFHTVRFQAAG